MCSIQKTRMRVSLNEISWQNEHLHSLWTFITLSKPQKPLKKAKPVSGNELFTRLTYYVLTTRKAPFQKGVLFVQVSLFDNHQLMHNETSSAKFRRKRVVKKLERKLSLYYNKDFVISPSKRSVNITYCHWIKRQSGNIFAFLFVVLYFIKCYEMLNKYILSYEWRVN